MCLDVLGYAPLHGVHTHCPYSNTVVKYKDINHHKTSDTECAWRFQGMHPYIVYTLIVRAQKDLFFVLLLNCVLLPCYSHSYHRLIHLFIPFTTVPHCMRYMPAPTVVQTVGTPVGTRASRTDGCLSLQHMKRS